MDTGTVTSLIGSLGFPIVACGALFWQLNKVQEVHREETQKLADAVNNNTQVISNLLTKLDEEIRR